MRSNSVLSTYNRHCAKFVLSKKVAGWIGEEVSEERTADQIARSELGRMGAMEAIHLLAWLDTVNAKPGLKLSVNETYTWQMEWVPPKRFISVAGVITYDN